MVSKKFFISQIQKQQRTLAAKKRMHQQERILRSSVKDIAASEVTKPRISSR